MSKESVKRALVYASALVLCLGIGLPASAQVALVVGSVRDRRGAPVAGASVTVRTPSGPAGTTTDANGTFAVEARGATAVTIACKYCETTSVPVRGFEPVVAIVHRYDALMADAPSASDLANLPYAHVESALALQPFALLSQSSHAYPGSRLSDRGLLSSGGLLVDDGVPNYDITGGSSPYASIPAAFTQSADVQTASSAFLYGDQAGGGIAWLRPFESGDDAQAALLGSDTILRLQTGSDSARIAAATFSNDDESRQRADGGLNFVLPADQSLAFVAGTEQGRDYSDPGTVYANSFTFWRGEFDDPRAENLTFVALADRGTYADAFGTESIGATWSDVGFTAGAHTNGPLQAFLDASTRFSTGFYDWQSSGLPRVAATLSQGRVDAGFDADGSWYDVLGGVGAFWAGYAGGTYGYSTPAGTSLITPSLSATLFPNGKFGATVAGSGSFTLPTFFDQYAIEYDSYSSVALTRSSLFSGELTYTDDARLRLAFEEATQSVRGASFGTVTSAGISATWQVAPNLSLRAWGMHVTDTAGAYDGTVPYGGTAPSVGALWATYDDGALRFDAIYRRDLLDDGPFYHVDGDVSGPISHGFRWYAGAEDRTRDVYVDAGLRFNP